MRSESETREMRAKFQTAYDELMHDDQPTIEELHHSKLVSVETTGSPDTLYDLVRILAWVLEEEWVR